jgi:hypothetical protein
MHPRKVSRAAITLAPSHRAVHTAGMRDYQIDYRMWGFVSGVMFFGIEIVWLATEGFDGFRFLKDSFILAGGCGLLGWIVQAVTVVCGVRLKGPPRPDQAVDYDDAPPSS